MRKCLMAAACVLGFALAHPMEPISQEPAGLAAMNAEASWIASLQDTDGAIQMEPSNSLTPSTINPYFANIAATGLSYSPNHLRDVQKYIEWYISHLNWPDNEGLYGTVYDYTVSQGVETPTDEYDSADAYAGTFITLLRTYVNEGGNVHVLIDHQDQISVIAGVMIKLMGSDSLTVAKPSYPVTYLMDNCEVYRGLEDMAFLCRVVFHDRAEAAYYESFAYQTRLAILTTFSNGDTFDVAISGENKQGVNWMTWNPDAISQLFPILDGVISPKSSQAKYLYATFNRYYQGWPNLRIQGPYPTVLVATVAEKMNDYQHVRDYLIIIDKTYVNRRHPYPWYDAESGWFIRLLAGLPDTFDINTGRSTN